MVHPRTEFVINQRTVPRHDRFHHAHGVFARRAARVAGAVIVVVSKEPADFSVSIDTSRPVNQIASARSET